MQPGVLRSKPVKRDAKDPGLSHAQIRQVAEMLTWEGPSTTWSKGYYSPVLRSPSLLFGMGRKPSSASPANIAFPFGRKSSLYFSCACCPVLRPQAHSCHQFLKYRLHGAGSSLWNSKNALCRSITRPKRQNNISSGQIQYTKYTGHSNKTNSRTKKMRQRVRNYLRIFFVCYL